MASNEDALVVCDRCGKAHRWSALAAGRLAKCVRCDAILGRGHRFGLDTVLALTTTAAVVYLIAISTDVLTLSLRGATVSTTLPMAVASAWQNGQFVVASVAAFTALIAPALFIGLRLYLLVPLAIGRVPRGFPLCVRILHQAARWNMVEVLTVGALLSMVRLAGLADAAAGPALFALGLLTVLFAAIESAGLKHLWMRV